MSVDGAAPDDGASGVSTDPARPLDSRSRLILQVQVAALEEMLDLLWEHDRKYGDPVYDAVQACFNKRYADLYGTGLPRERRPAGDGPSAR